MSFFAGKATPFNADILNMSPGTYAGGGKTK
jgi:hypothetical protein